jgi:hypothetical protein
MKAGRWLLLVIPPVAFGITGMLHLAAAGGGPTAGGEFQKIMDHADLWITIHTVQIAIICLLGGTLLVLARGLRSRTATMVRVAVVPFVAFYSAFDSTAGLANGLLARYALEHPAQAGVIADGSSALNALDEPVIAIIYAIGVVCWLLAAGGVAFALRGYVPTAAIVLLGAGAVVFAIDHAAPFGPVGMALFLAGSIVAELGRKAEVPVEAGAAGQPPGPKTMDRQAYIRR